MRSRGVSSRAGPSGGSFDMEFREGPEGLQFLFRRSLSTEQERTDLEQAIVALRGFAPGDFT